MIKIKTNPPRCHIILNSAIKEELISSIITSNKNLWEHWCRITELEFTAFISFQYTWQYNIYFSKFKVLKVQLLRKLCPKEGYNRICKKIIYHWPNGVEWRCRPYIRFDETSLTIKCVLMNYAFQSSTLKFLLWCNEICSA